MPSSSFPPTSPVGNQHAPSRLPRESFEDDVNPNSANTNASVSCSPPLTQQPIGQTPAGINIAPRPRTPVTFGQQNARSYVYGGHRDGGNSLRSSDWPHYSFAGVRQQTAELATIALAHGTAPGPRAADLARSRPDIRGVSSLSPHPSLAAGARGLADAVPSQSLVSTPAPAPFSSPPPSPPLRPPPPGSSHLSRLFGSGPCPAVPPPGVRAADGPAMPNERDPLLPSHPNRPPSHVRRPAAPDGDRCHDLEAQGWQKPPTITSASTTGTATAAAGAISLRPTARALAWRKHGGFKRLHQLSVPNAWRSGVLQPLKFLPAVCLGLLLNVLDGLSYGMILFPLGESIFSDLGPDGLSMFYVSCIVSQLVYSCGGSAFKGGIGSEMIEVVPFFHKMAFTILADVGPNNPKSVLATTILAYALSSVLTGAVFFSLGYLRLGSLVGFFPRHILVGCIGGVGWFLLATALEVCARLDGSLRYDLDTLALLFAPATFALWIVPLLLAFVLILAQRVIKSPLFMPLYFLSIPVVFHILVAATPGLDITGLRHHGWVFDAPVSGAPFWHFYTLYDLHAVSWSALAKTVPAMVALTFFGILHVPINVPALGVSTGMDSVDVDRELIAHGLSNALSGACGSIQNYLVYSNSILFIRAGADSRVAGVMLAAATFGVMAAGPAVVGYIPVMVVGALIFLLGIELMREALYDTWGKLSKLEYLTICAIVITMGAWDFVVGILVGVLLACVSLVVQTSRKSPIRAAYTGAVARSTVRRHPTQQSFLRRVGSQIEILKLAGYMFFGTIASVETRVKSLLERHRTTRFVVLDLLHVSGVDFSAAEAFTRMQRLMATRGVTMILSGVVRGGDIGNALHAVGVWETALVFETLNEALEYCENEFLKALYHDATATTTATTTTVINPTITIPTITTPTITTPATITTSAKLLQVPKANGFEPSSPRRSLVQAAAAVTMTSDEVQQTTRWASFRQPLPLILQTFQGITDKNEDFWFSVCSAFVRCVFEEGETVFSCGDRSTAFYLIEEGIFRAEYHLDQGWFTESIVAGTTCGELPFFSETPRTATVVAEKQTVAWVMNLDRWRNLQKENQPAVEELLRISLKLTTERMHAITSYVLTSAG